MNFSSKLLENAVNEMSRLPGIGKRTALRLVLFLHKIIPSTKSINDLDNWTVCEFGWFNKNKTSLKAVLLPIPGNLDISFTVFSSNFEEKLIL